MKIVQCEEGLLDDSLGRVEWESPSWMLLPQRLEVAPSRFKNKGEMKPVFTIDKHTSQHNEKVVISGVGWVGVAFLIFTSSGKMSLTIPIVAANVSTLTAWY